MSPEIRRILPEALVEKAPSAVLEALAGLAGAPATPGQREVKGASFAAMESFPRANNATTETSATMILAPIVESLVVETASFGAASSNATTAIPTTATAVRTTVRCLYRRAATASSILASNATTRIPIPMTSASTARRLDAVTHSFGLASSNAMTEIPSTTMDVRIAAS